MGQSCMKVRFLSIFIILTLFSFGLVGILDIASKQTEVTAATLYVGGAGGGCPAGLTRQ